MIEHATYNSDVSRWFRYGDDLSVRVVDKLHPAPGRGRGEKIPPVFSVQADTYLQAFELLYGKPYAVPAPMREPRHGEAE